MEALIQEAMDRGEFDNLPGRGKPIDLTPYFNTPEEVRLVYSILKNANTLPEEAHLLMEIAALKEQMLATDDRTERRKIRKSIDHLLLKFRLGMEHRKLHTGLP